MKQVNTSVIITHIASWLLFAGLPVVFITSQSDNVAVTNVLLSPDYWLCFLFFFCLFYLHSYLLFPLFYRQNKRVVYFVSMALLFLLLLWLKPFDALMSHWHQVAPQRTATGQMPPPEFAGDNRNPPPPHNDEFRNNPRPPQAPRGESRMIDIISIFMFVVTLAISISTDVSQRLRIAAGQAAQAEADRMQAELSTLKAQVNPHFLFNTLNNIYALALTGNENTAESILKLSNIMRYVTDDAPQNFVSLQIEWDCITDFLDLQKLRTGRKMSLAVSVEGDLENTRIAPFILLTFIENAFKYGISNKEVSLITIRLQATHSGIVFYCSNPVYNHTASGRKSTGIANIKKRLAYLYPDRHSLSVSTNNNLFIVELHLQDNYPFYAVNMHRH